MNLGSYVAVVCGALGMLGCSGAGSVAARPPTPLVSPTGAAAVSSPGPSALTPPQRAQATARAIEYDDESEADRVFIENAERAIAEYSEFLVRAGDSPEYARAVQRSREQIEDLRQAILFVRAGAAQRAAH